MRFLFILALSVLCSSCYKLPSDDCISTIPVTNNPQVVPQKGGGGMSMPGVDY